MVIENVILLIGIALALGFAIGKITHHLRLTAIVGYIVTGIILGPVFHIVKLGSYPIHLIVSSTLGFVAFVIGGSFVIDILKKLGKTMLIILFGQFFITFIAVTIGLYLTLYFCPWLLGSEIPILSAALLFGVLSTATAPTGTMAALHDCRARGTLSTFVTAIVGLDDGLGILLFAFVIAFIKVLLGGSFSVSDAVFAPLMEIFGAIGLGIAIGIMLSYSVKYIKRRGEIFIASIAGVLLCTGLAEILGFSLILACMALGATFANLSPNISKVSHEILEGVIPSVYIIFFVTAGIQLRIDLLIAMGTIAVVYILCRIIGKIGGATLSSRVAKAEPRIQKYCGISLLSQAGVAIALACMAAVELASYGWGEYLGGLAITTILAADVIFEIIGPIGVRYAVTRAGESGRG
jgi:Kef-type K+ transport system membrane component KefB